MITLSRCACSGIAHIFAEESRYNNQYTPWSAMCECTKCGFRTELSAEYSTSEAASEKAAERWNSHPMIKGRTKQIKSFSGFITSEQAKQINAELKILSGASKMKPYIGDTPEQLGSLLVADALMVDGYLITKQHAREMKADIEFLLEQSLLIEHAQNHEKQRELRAKYGIRWL